MQHEDWEGTKAGVERMGYNIQMRMGVQMRTGVRVRMGVMMRV